MNKQKKKGKTILAIAVASLSIILLVAVGLSLLFAHQNMSASTSTSELSPNHNGSPEPTSVTINNAVELNSSEGFTSSIIVDSASASSSPLLVLPSGGNGTVPFLVSADAPLYTNSNVTFPFNVSLSVELGSQEAYMKFSQAQSYGVQFSVSPSNFTFISSGEQVKAVLTITADKDAPTAFYSPTIVIQENDTSWSYPNIDLFGGTEITMPPLFIATNFTPSCLFLLNAFTLPVVTSPLNSNSSMVNASTSPVTEIQTCNFLPAIDMVAGEKATVIFGCLTEDNLTQDILSQDKLSLNVSNPPGFNCDFSPNPINIIYTCSSTSGKIYALTVTANKNISSGTYEVNGTGSIGSYVFGASFYVEIS